MLYRQLQFSQMNKAATEAYRHEHLYFQEDQDAQPQKSYRPQEDRLGDAGTLLNHELSVRNEVTLRNAFPFDTSFFPPNHSLKEAFLLI